MIDFELTPQLRMIKDGAHAIAESSFRPISRKYDEEEHTVAEELKPLAGLITGGMGDMTSKKKDKKKDPGAKKEHRNGSTLLSVIGAVELAWGDNGLMLAMPGSGLGNFAIQAVATPEQLERFGSKFAAMAITEPNSGSDSGSISTTAKQDGDEWVINGEKIFVTDGNQCDVIVVWATIDKAAGKAGIKSFIVEKDRAGCTVTKLEHKLGIRASDTASVVFEDCRIPKNNILGSSEIKTKTEGFKGVMKTFDSTRPMVGAIALGVARAAFEFTKKILEDEGYQFRYGLSKHKLVAVEKEILTMEAELEAIRLLIQRAAWMSDNGMHNAVEASMSKAKGGRMGSEITRRCVALLGPIGYSREWLVEKWMRDCKINDIYEGTQQIQQLIIARGILDYSKKELQ